MKPGGILIIGGSGYGAGELLRLLSLHPAIEVAAVVSRTYAGQPVTRVHTHLAGVSDLVFSAEPDLRSLERYTERAVVLAMPSGQAVPALTQLTAAGLTDRTVVVDLSGDLRLHDEELHRRHYPDVPFSPELRGHFRYGLSELSPPPGTRISNPGCLATAAILALAPFSAGALSGSVVVDAKTGTSGAGREPQAALHHPARAADVTAYKVLEHRHEPEILQALGASFQDRHPVMFVPHLLPVSRGIVVTAYATLAQAATSHEITSQVTHFYRHAPFVRVRETPPRLVDVVGTNFCDIAVAVRERQIVVMTALDNLGKGMAGQAIQNINRAFGLPEETGLRGAALGPV